MALVKLHIFLLKNITLCLSGATFLIKQTPPLPGLQPQQGQKGKGGAPTIADSASQLTELLTDHLTNSRSCFCSKGEKSGR